MVFVYNGQSAEEKEVTYLSVIDKSKLPKKEKEILKKEIEKLQVSKKQKLNLAILLTQCKTKEERLALLHSIKEIFSFSNSVTNKTTVNFTFKGDGLEAVIERKGWIHGGDDITIEISKRKDGKWVINIEGNEVVSDLPLVLREVGDNWEGPYLVAKGDNVITAVDPNANDYVGGKNGPLNSAIYDRFNNIYTRAYYSWEKYEKELSKKKTKPSPEQESPEKEKEKKEKKPKKVIKPSPEEVEAYIAKVEGLIGIRYELNSNVPLNHLIRTILYRTGCTPLALSFWEKLFKKVKISKKDRPEDVYIKLVNYLANNKARYVVRDDKGNIVYEGFVSAKIDKNGVTIYFQMKGKKPFKIYECDANCLKDMELMVKDNKVVKTQPTKPPQKLQPEERPQYLEKETKELQEAIKNIKEGKVKKKIVKIRGNSYIIKKEGEKTYIETNAGRFDITQWTNQNKINDIKVNANGEIEVGKGTFAIVKGNTPLEMSYNLVITPHQSNWDVRVVIPTSLNTEMRARVLSRLVTQLQARNVLTNSTGVSIDLMNLPTVQSGIGPAPIALYTNFTIPSGAKNISVAVVKEGNRETVVLSFEKDGKVVEQYEDRRDVYEWNPKAQGTVTQVIVKGNKATVILQKDKRSPGTTIHLTVKKGEEEKVKALKGKEVIIYERKEDRAVKHKVVVKEKGRERELIFEEDSIVERNKEKVVERQIEEEKVTEREEEVKEKEEKKETLLDKITKVREGLAKVSYGAMIIGGLLGLGGIATAGIWSVIFTITSIIAAVSIILALIGHIKFIKDNFKRLKKEGKLTEAYLTLVRDGAIAVLYGVSALSFLGLNVFGLTMSIGKISSAASYLLMLYNLVKPKEKKKD